MEEFRIVTDIEASGLLDSTTIDYRQAPFKLKPIFRVWCAVIEDIDTGVVYKFAGEEELRNGYIPLLLKATKIIGHNIIDYDLLVLKLYFDIDYEIGDGIYSLNGRRVDIVDTLVLSKTLNPDRFGGHSLGEWGKRLGFPKMDWRAEAISIGLIDSSAPPGAEFQQYHPRMLDYNAIDVSLNVKLYWHLMNEWGTWNWAGAFALEQYTRDITTRASHRGFKFDSELAEKNVHDLDEKIEAIRKIVEPLLPPKPMGVTKIKDYLPPKIQFKKNGELSSNLLRFIAKHDGRHHYDEATGKHTVCFFNEARMWTLPLNLDVPIKTHEPSSVQDTTHIKGWLVSLGWRPTQYKERDLTCDTKKNKLPHHKFVDTVTRYVEQTLKSPFKKDRLEELNATEDNLLSKLLAHDNTKRPLKVYTNPAITVGMEKEMDPTLSEITEEFPHAKLIAEYLTYAHRRNSILGGGFDPDEVDEDDEFAGKGFLAVERLKEDGRIPTPADTCGAATSRFKHRVVTNIPRVTSLYGESMRAMFGTDADEGHVQMGYDFDSLEAMMEAHYVYKYKGGPEYGVSLTAKKPFDCHSMLAERISKILGRPFPRGTAKNVKYGCLPVDTTEVLTPTGWKTFDQLQLGDKVVSFDGYCLAEDVVLDRWYYKDAELYNFGNNLYKVECTQDHKWLVAGGTKPWPWSFKPKYTWECLNFDKLLVWAPPFLCGDEVKAAMEHVRHGQTVAIKDFSIDFSRKADVFCLTTGNSSFVIRQNGIITVTGNCSYNAQPPRVAKTIGCDLGTAKIVFDAFWDSAACLKDLKEKMQKYWETTGEKKFLVGLDGRKLPIRSKGNVINTAFQSAGVICAKRAMVIHDQTLKAEGLAVDFFRDNWRAKKYCQQLIAYHK